MRFKGYINELSMKKNTSIKLIKTTSHDYQVEITLENEEKFLFVAYKEDAITWEIAFVDSKGSVKIEPKDKGVSLELFAALPKVVEMFIKSKNPSTFFFTSKPEEVSRVKLYTLLAKKIEKSGYIFKKPTLGGEKVFLFDKA